MWRIIETQSCSFISVGDGGALTFNNWILKILSVPADLNTEEERAVVAKVLVVPVQILRLDLQVLRGVPVAQPDCLPWRGDQDDLPVVWPGLGGRAPPYVGQVSVQSGDQLRHQSRHLLGNSAHH